MPIHQRLTIPSSPLPQFSAAPNWITEATRPLCPHTPPSPITIKESSDIRNPQLNSQAFRCSPTLYQLRMQETNDQFQSTALN